MLLPKLNFNVTNMDSDERIGRRNSAIGVRQRESDHRSFEKRQSCHQNMATFKSPVSVAHCLPVSFHRNPVLHSPPMNSYTTEPEPSHGDLLADRLRRLDNPDDQSVQAPSTSTVHPTPSLPKAPYDGYGFRLPSGMSSPLAPTDRNSPLPDVNGLGWPGEPSFLLSHPLPRSIPSSSNQKQSRPSRALPPLPPRKPPAKQGSPRPCAPSSNASVKIPIEKVCFARRNDMPRPSCG